MAETYGAGLGVDLAHNLYGARTGRMQDAIDYAQRQNRNATIQGMQMHNFLEQGANAGFDFADIERAVAISLDMEMPPPTPANRTGVWYDEQDALATLRLWRDRVLQEV